MPRHGCGDVEHEADRMAAAAARLLGREDFGVARPTYMDTNVKRTEFKNQSRIDRKTTTK